MKKKIKSLLLAVLLAASLPAAAVHGETVRGSKGWNVTFTADKKMESSFKSSDLDEAIYGMQPGDNAILRLKLKNDNSITTDWYMTNEILYSLEDRSANAGTSGGAYAYRLAYTDKDGKETVLFDSDTVGGEGESGAGEGLKQAGDALGEYLYLDTLAKGEGGSVTLEVALDGETQGNDYQDTLADLQMNFAVETAPETRPTAAPSRTPAPGTPGPARPSTEPIHDLGTPTAMVQTGDDTEMDGWILAACISGGVLLILSFYGAVRRKKQEGGQ